MTNELVGLVLRPAADPHVQRDVFPEVKVGVPTKPAAAAAGEAHRSYREGGAALGRPDVIAGHGLAEGSALCRLSQVLGVRPYFHLWSAFLRS